ncbi:M15 family metallopeptidase [Peribacillus loiseleuriae]|uniref:M15 family metallopeptidase n=1 Tax=Peribacillus loiseleuriae TaxID=1679170 RepID=UPI003830CEE7
MIVALQTLLDKSINKMGAGIHPVVRDSALEVIRLAYQECIYVQISDGYRSIAEQDKLYAQGRTAPGKVVTNAKGGQSNHNYGLAVDYFLLTPDGKTALWTVNNDWLRVAAIAKSLGFVWGGDFKTIYDPPHLEMMGGLKLKDLQNGKMPNLISKVTVAVAAKKEEPHVAERDIDKVSDWAKKDWEEAVANGYFDGTRPGASITREEAAIVINRLRKNLLDLINK